MSRRVRILRGVGLALLASVAASNAHSAHPMQAAQPADAPAQARLLVEIPAGGFTKYEADDDGLIHVDRFLSMPMAYPANYGAMPGTLAGDGDPLDALVITRAPLYPGVLIRFRPLGVLRMRDGGAADEKIVGVPADDVDPTYADLREITDLPQIERDRIEAFFRVYKDLPAGRARIELSGWGDAAEARALMRAAVDAFEAAR